MDTMDAVVMQSMQQQHLRRRGVLHEVEQDCGGAEQQLQRDREQSAYGEKYVRESASRAAEHSISSVCV